MTAKAYKDTEFKIKFENPKKNLDECVLYIQHKMLEKVTEEQKKGGAAVVIPSDDEIFALAEQYYMDDDLKVDGEKFNDVKVVSASATSFSDEEKQKMREEAIKKYQDEVIAEQRKKDQAKKDKAKKCKEKKPSTPIFVPDTQNEEKKEEKETENKVAQQLSLF